MRTKQYWLLLICMALVVSVLLSVNQTQARYSTMAVWNTVVDYSGVTLTSDCLAQEEQIILLGDLADEREFTFSLGSDQKTAQTLSWSCEKNQYLTVELELGTKTLVSGEKIELSPQENKEVYMILTPTEAALTEPHEELAIDVVVECGRLRGIFRVNMPAVEAEEAATEATEPTQPSTETEEATEPEEETTEPTAAPTEATQPKSEPEETEETTQSSKETTQPATESESETEAQEQTTGGTADTVATGNAVLTMDTIASVNPTGMLPVVLNLTGNAEYIQLGIEVEKKTLLDSTVYYAEFPAYTRYCLNGVNYMLYSGGYIEIDLSETSDSQIYLLLDLSNLELSLGQDFTLTGKEFQGDASIGDYSVTTRTDADLSAATTPQFLIGSLLAEPSDESVAVSIGFPLNWIDGDLSFSYSVQMLRDGVYRPVSTDSETIKGTYLQSADSEEHMLTLSFGGTLPPAGTYRINMSWTYQGYPFQTFEVPLFVQYGARSGETEESTVQ